MELWDASIYFVTMVVRASSAEEAREIAIENVRPMGLSKLDAEPDLTPDWPRRLGLDGPAEVVLEDLS
jgi:hypothetical protein